MLGAGGMTMRTLEHLAAALMDAGLQPEDARETAEEAFAAHDPRATFAEAYRRAEDDLRRETVRTNALRAVRDRWNA